MTKLLGTSLLSLGILCLLGGFIAIVQGDIETAAGLPIAFTLMGMGSHFRKH